MVRNYDPVVTLDSMNIHTMYTPDERAAFALARSELVKP